MIPWDTSWHRPKIYETVELRCTYTYYFVVLFVAPFDLIIILSYIEFNYNGMYLTSI